MERVRRAVENTILVALNEYNQSSMQLGVDSNAAYLVKPGAKSRYTGHFYLASYPNTLNYNKSPNNMPILTKYKILKNIVCSAAEVECGGLFHNS
eukprot:221310-Ditylum_brightwellii.AAC.1